MNILMNKTYVAGAAIPANSIVKFGADDNTVIVATAVGDASIGVSLGFAAATDQRIDVLHFGLADVKLGVGGITRGAEVTSDASGQGVAAAATNRVVGVAFGGGVAGDIVPVMISLATK